MIACLPMYDRAETAEAHDALWAGVRDALRARGVAAPDRLDREIGMWEGWEHPDLVLGQTCGLPYRTRLHGRVTLLATFDFGFPEAAPGYYVSQLVVRANDARVDPHDLSGARLAYNQPESHSGWAAPQIWAAARGLALLPAVETGGHRASARAVAEGKADVAAIDATTWRAIERWEPEVATALKVIGHTDPAPGLPLIAAPGSDADLLIEAIAEGLDRLPKPHRETLGIKGHIRIPAEDYLAVATPPPPDHSPA